MTNEMHDETTSSLTLTLKSCLMTTNQIFLSFLSFDKKLCNFIS